MAKNAEKGEKYTNIPRFLFYTKGLGQCGINPPDCSKWGLFQIDQTTIGLSLQ